MRMGSHGINRVFGAPAALMAQRVLPTEGPVEGKTQQALLYINHSYRTYAVSAAQNISKADSLYTVRGIQATVTLKCQATDEPAAATDYSGSLVENVSSLQNVTKKKKQTHLKANDRMLFAVSPGWSSCTLCPHPYTSFS